MNHDQERIIKFDVGFCDHGHVHLRFRTEAGTMELWLDREAAMSLADQLVSCSDDAMMASATVAGHA